MLSCFDNNWNNNYQPIGQRTNFITHAKKKKKIYIYIYIYKTKDNFEIIKIWI